MEIVIGIVAVAAFLLVWAYANRQIDKSNQKVKELEQIEAQRERYWQNEKEQMRKRAQIEAQEEYDEFRNRLNAALEEEQKLKVAALERQYEDYVKQIGAQKESIEEDMRQIRLSLESLESQERAIIDHNKRRLEDSLKEEFYSLNFAVSDLGDVEILRGVIGKLNNKKALNKAIYTVYYEKPLIAMTGRVIGRQKVTGIYKITNMKTQECYVGQSVDIGNRWKQHVKRAVGVEEPTQNKLYPAMQAIGVENFRWEVLEVCDAADLNRKEKWWQNYFAAQEFGYSIK